MKKLCEDMAMAMYREGRLDREIAEAIGYSRVSVTNWRKDRGLPPNRSRRPEKMLDAYKAAMSLERAQELAQNEKDGRLVVLPCKLGDTVYIIRDRKIIITTVETIYQWSSGKWNLNVHTDKKYRHWVGYEVSFDDFGETAFLTREEAEAALKKRETDNETD